MRVDAEELSSGWHAKYGKTYLRAASPPWPIYCCTSDGRQARLPLIPEDEEMTAKLP